MLGAEGWLRLVALAAAMIAVAIAVTSPEPVRPCRAERGACARAGLPACSLDLGPWRVARPRASGLTPGRSASSCVLRADGTAASAVVALVPHPLDVSGDTLLSRSAARDPSRQRARVRLTVHGAPPDHWVFALAGGFVDVDAPHRCAELGIAPPVNAGYALIGGNWESRPHGFYFERLADACVYDGRRDACGGAVPFIPHEFVADEAFVLDLALHRGDDSWWLEGSVAQRDASGSARPLGTLRRAVAPPCWLVADEPARALVLTIPTLESAGDPDARVEVADFAWQD